MTVVKITRTLLIDRGEVEGEPGDGTSRRIDRSTEVQGVVSLAGFSEVSPGVAWVSTVTVASTAPLSAAALAAAASPSAAPALPPFSLRQAAAAHISGTIISGRKRRIDMMIKLVRGNVLASA